MARRAVFDILTNDADVSNLVSDRIYPVLAPSGIGWPALIINVVATDPTEEKDGPSTLDTYRIQIDAWSQKYEEAADLSEKCRLALDRKSGTFGGDQVDSISFVNATDRRDDELEVFGISSDFQIRIHR